MSNFKNYIITVVILLFCYPAVVQAGAGPPDVCLDASPITDGDTLFDTSSATTDGPSLCATIGSDIWYTYTATCTGNLLVNTCDSDFDTVLNLYDGTDCTMLSSLTSYCSDDDCSETSGSQVVVPVVMGNDYLIQVGGYGGSTGTGTLNVSCLVPECTDPTALDVPSTTTGSTDPESGVSGFDDAATCGDADAQSSPGVWYTVTGTGNTMTASTCDMADFDTELSVWCADCADLTCVAGNDDGDGCSGYTSQVSWCSQDGATYRILVYGYLEANGIFDLDVSDDGVACTPEVECTATTTTGCDQYSGTTEKLCTKYCEKLQCDEYIPRHDILRRWLCKYYGYKFERRTGTEPPCDGLM